MGGQEPQSGLSSAPGTVAGRAGLDNEFAREALNRQRDEFQAECRGIVEAIVQPNERAVTSATLQSAAKLMLSRGNNQQLYDEMQMVMGEVAGRVFDEVLRSLEKKAQVEGKTGVELEALMQDALEHSKEMMQAGGETIKMKNQPYGGSKASQDAMDTEELFWFNDWITKMRSVDPVEFADMVREDYAFLTMMEEEGRQSPQDKVDGLLAYPGDGPERPGAVEKYARNIGALADFILGFDKDAPGAKAKSGFRKGSEAQIWHEIVRNMDTQKQADLINQLVIKAGPEKARDTVAGFVIAGVMTRGDLDYLFDKGKIKGIEAGLNGYKDFKQFTQVAAVAKENVQQEMADFTHQMDNPQVPNGVAYFFTFNKLGVETLGRIGALTAVFNAVISLVDRFKYAPHDEAWYTSLAKGMKDVVTNEYVLGGAAAAVVASEVIFPWMKNVAYSPDADEKEKLSRVGEMKFLQEQADNHTETMTYFVDHYNKYYELAQARNGQDQKFDMPDGKGKKTLKREPVLYVGDLTAENAEAGLKLSPEDAEGMGFDRSPEGARFAEAKIIRMFNICNTTLKGQDLTSRDKLLDFFDHTVFLKKRQDVPNQPQI